MANSRELAEQAIALLQSALSESEARASDLDEQLKRKRAPKSDLEEQLEAVTHRLESTESERRRWEHQAGHLEEIAEAERVKVAQLKKKLEIAESGPDKITKKEINFWRQKAETIDAQIKEYQERLGLARRELNDRDTLIEQLRSSTGAPDAALAVSEPQADDELRRQLEQRDSWLTELRLELHELRAQPAPPLETQAEVETLRSQITGLEHALAESHNLRAAAQANFTRAEREIAERERAIREATAMSEHARESLSDREHRIVELSAEVEQLHNELRQRDDRNRDALSRHDEQVAALTRDIEALRGRLEQDRHDTAAARAALELALHEREHEAEKQQQLLTATEREFGELQRQLAHREQAAAEMRQQVDEQYREVQERDRELADSQQQLRDLSQDLAERDQRFATSSGELEHLRATLSANDREIDGLREALRSANRELEQAGATLTARGHDIDGLRESLQSANRDIDGLRESLQSANRDIDGLRETLQSANRELEHAGATLTANERELSSLRETLISSSRELDELRAAKQLLEGTLEQSEARTAAAAQDIQAAREQIAGLENELKEERDHAESLGELANERREHMTKLQEQAEEAEERFAEANWKLGRSLYFERIVQRRRGLIAKLLAALRAKMKANVALKAGLDGLRTFKAASEMNQHKLLQRIDGLKADLKEADETVKRHQGGTAAKEELTNAISRATALEDRLNTQAELIQSLEADLKAAKLSHKAGDDKHLEIERLTKELETKNQVIQKLEADTDDQQRKLSKLRGSESETVRLKALTEKDRSEIDALQREVAQLRDALARQSGVTASPANGNNADLEAKLKEHEATIKKLAESSDSWKRKYQFLASDQPVVHKNAAEK